MCFFFEACIALFIQPCLGHLWSVRAELTPTAQPSREAPLIASPLCLAFWAERKSGGLGWLILAATHAPPCWSRVRLSPVICRSGSTHRFVGRSWWCFMFLMQKCTNVHKLSHPPQILQFSSFSVTYWLAVCTLGWHPHSAMMGLMVRQVQQKSQKLPSAHLKKETEK